MGPHVRRSLGSWRARRSRAAAGSCDPPHQARSCLSYRSPVRGDRLLDVMTCLFLLTHHPSIRFPAYETAPLLLSAATPAPLSGSCGDRRSATPSSPSAPFRPRGTCPLIGTVALATIPTCRPPSSHCASCCAPTRRRCWATRAASTPRPSPCCYARSSAVIACSPPSAAAPP